MYPESTTGSPARLSLRQTGSPGMIYRGLPLVSMSLLRVGMRQAQKDPQHPNRAASASCATRWRSRRALGTRPGAAGWGGRPRCRWSRAGASLWLTPTVDSSLSSFSLSSFAVRSTRYGSPKRQLQFYRPGGTMLSMTYSESLRSVSSRCHSDWALHPVRQTDTVELQRLRAVRAAAQARNMESFLHMHGLSLDGCTAQRTGMKYRWLRRPHRGTGMACPGNVAIWCGGGQLALYPRGSQSRGLSPKAFRASLGKSGLRVSCLGLGTWVTFGGQITDEMAEQLMTLAYDNGINLFDTAEVYAAGKAGLMSPLHCNETPCLGLLCRAEVVLGSIIKKKGWRRSSLVITTKIFWGGKAETERGLSRKHIIEGLKASLERLQLEYVDVVFANRPDPNTPMEETVRAMTHVINQGMAMYWGTSRWSSMEIMEAYSVARQFNLIPPICEQAEYHMFQREKVEVQLPELFHKIGVGAMTWSPLACGIVSGKYDSGVPPYSRASLKGYQWLKDKILSEEGRRQQAKLKELQAIAERLGCTLPQLAIAWCLRNEGVSSVLLGASSADQLMENIGAIQVLPKLSSSIIHEIDSILGNKPYSKKDYRS
ncbi:hypothetical protein MC885_005100 [Smutsia gigantea]|nr:hypothetical protein MC885_005100 [Smutsia gigantea]